MKDFIEDVIGLISLVLSVYGFYIIGSMIF
jgi:hypothetical protein